MEGQFLLWVFAGYMSLLYAAAIKLNITWIFLTSISFPWKTKWVRHSIVIDL